MQAVADALSPLANIVMAWNTARKCRRCWTDGPTLVPTRLEGINLRGVFRFPVERYAAQLLPSQTAGKTRASG